MDYGRSTLADALAAQYVAGTLRSRARRRFENLLSAHPALRDAVRAWQDRLMPLTAPIEPVAPPPAVWAGIEQRLWPAPAAASWWQRLGLWRGVSAFASVAALAFAVLLMSPQPVQPPVVVVLQGTGASGTSAAGGGFVASFTADGRALVARPLQPVALQGVPADYALELWAVPAKGDVRSLGLVSGNGSTVVPRDKLAALKADTAALAVTLEPPGGAPNPPKHGPILFVGKLQL
jgi:anti-sigma-K factor RskA